MRLWMKDGKQLTNELLNLLWQTSQEYRKDAPPTEPEETTAPTQSSASAMPGDPMTVQDGSEDPEKLPESTTTPPTQESQPTEQGQTQEQSRDKRRSRPKARSLPIPRRHRKPNRLQLPTIRRMTPGRFPS